MLSEYPRKAKWLSPRKAGTTAPTSRANSQGENHTIPSGQAYGSDHLLGTVPSAWIMAMRSVACTRARSSLS